ncbi:phasin family protein [Lysobacter yananisis]|uniref:Phasin family protein n=1 Tax=Lysobacter yananisis TaxID=1003114 RepID=A0ABY9P4I4_9GAMM|nr:phasin family protein [Lysobacter yananisis]WMT01755.1 phasin family protein [Lysobacter yananisis]
MAAKFKKTAKKTSGKTRSAGAAGKGAGAQEQAERLSKSLSESAQQIWLAGVGAFGRAQAEGTKLFEGLVKEGLTLEQATRKFTGGQAGALRDAVESKVGQARERAADTWDRLEKVFEERVQRALVKLGVPGREDLAELSERVDALTAELRRQGGAAPARKTARAAKPKAAKAADKPAKAKAPRKAVAKPKPPVAP